MRANDARVLALSIFGFFCDPGTAGQEATDMHLMGAGFIVRVADTPAKIARREWIRCRAIVRRITVSLASSPLAWATYTANSFVVMGPLAANAALHSLNASP